MQIGVQADGKAQGHTRCRVVEDTYYDVEMTQGAFVDAGRQATVDIEDVHKIVLKVALVGRREPDMSAEPTADKVDHRIQEQTHALPEHEGEQDIW